MKWCTLLFARTTLAIACLAIMAPTRQAKSEVFVSVIESNGDVVVTGSGTLNLTSLTPDGDGHIDSTLNPELATFVVGNGFFQYYETLLSGPNDFGPGVLTFAGSSSGEPFGVLQNGYTDFVLLVPRLYSSGDPVSATATYAGQTFGNLGLTPGIYQWNWGSGDDADSITMGIGFEVPEPSALALFVVGAAAIAVAGTRSGENSPKRFAH